MIADWHNCYDDSWKGIITPESFAHPAKYAFGLVRRILNFGLSEGYWKPGDVIGDPFGGVATGGIMAGVRDLRWIGVELEPRFVEMAQANIDLHKQDWEAHPRPTILQGDSRRFAEIVGEVCGAVTSPPYSEGLGHGGEYKEVGAGGHKNKQAQVEGYGETPGQIGALSSGSLDAAITSPPYAKSVHDGNGIDQSKLTGNKAGGNTQAKAEGYGTSEGQIGRDSGETYWQAMRVVYSQMHTAMKPRAVSAVVVKDYVKAKQRVPLCDQTAQLLERLGFTVFLRCRCWLVKESSHPSLFHAEPIVEKTERKSFFRRLAEKKGSPSIDWEEVIWAIK